MMYSNMNILDRAVAMFKRDSVIDVGISCSLYTTANGK